MKFPTKIQAVLSLLLGAHHARCTSAFNGSESELEQVMNQMQLDTLEFASEMERVFAEGVRCASTTLTECPEAHYHECNSVLPYAECKGGAELARAECPSLSGGLQCSGRYDFFTTSIRLAPHIAKTSDNNPTSTEVRKTTNIMKLCHHFSYFNMVVHTTFLPSSYSCRALCFLCFCLLHFT
jgi:hypothetical protein